MIMRHSIIFFILLVLLLSYSYGGIGGSGYSRYGLGDIRYFPSSRAIGMGGASIAVISNNSIDAYNPAAWTRLSYTMFSAGVIYEGYSAKDYKNSEYLSSTYFNHIMLTVPIAVSSGIVFGAGIATVSDVNYDIITQFPYNNLDCQLEYRGSGGLSLAHVGLSAAASKVFNFGAKINYYFGTIQHNVYQKFSSTDYTNSSVERTNRLKGVGYTFGAIYTGLKNLLKLSEAQSLDFGVVFTPTLYLSSSNENYLEYITSQIVTRDTVAESDSKVRFPHSLGLGISYHSEPFLLAADVYYQNWARYDARGINHSDYRDSYRYCVGAELLPKREQSAAFYQRMAYQVGFFYNSTCYRIKGEPINEIGITGSIGIPIVRDAKMYISAEYGFRGTTDMQLQKDKILRIFITLDGSERWFIRTEED